MLGWRYSGIVAFEILTAVTVKSAAFWVAVLTA
jgi:hypothetical protein